MNNIWVVVVSYNAAKWIEACLNSVNEGTIKAHVVVIDNLSTDNTLEILNKKYPDTKAIINDKNYGFGVANNIGINHALQSGADSIVLLNQDAKLNNDTLEKLSSYARQYPEYGILSPMFYSYDGKNLDAYVLNWIFNYNLELASDIFFKRPKDVYDVNLMPAAMWFMPRKALEEAGGFDPLFFMYGEDEDLWNRIRSRGWKTGFFPKTSVYHHTSKNSYTIQKRIWYAWAGNIKTLKGNQTSYSINLLTLLKNYFRNTMNAVIDLNKSELYVTQVVFFKTMLRLKLIYKNRRASLLETGPFLN